MRIYIFKSDIYIGSKIVSLDQLDSVAGGLERQGYYVETEPLIAPKK